MADRRNRRSIGAVLSMAASAIALALIPVAVATPAHADEDDFTFDSFHADMTLDRAEDGHAELSVTETIVARFPDADQNRGIVRAIPDEDKGVPLRTEVLSVTGNDGAALPYEVEKRGGFVEVATGDDSFVRGMQTYVITYTQRDTIRAFENTASDEFYRDINGTGWSQPFGEVSATIFVDPTLTPALTGNVACYVGAQGSTQTCEVARRGGENGEASQFYPQAFDLGARENVTIAIGFAPGTFAPGVVERSAIEEFAISAAPALRLTAIAASILGILAAAGAFLARRPGRDSPGRGIIVPEYEAPHQVSVMQAAHLVARGAAAIPAAIVDLAVRGNLRILAREDGTDVALEYAAPAGRSHERQRVLDAIFDIGAEPGTRLRLSGDQADFARRLTALSASSAAELRAAGLTEKQKHGGAAAAFIAAFAAFLLALGCTILLGIAGALDALSIAAMPVTFVAGVVTILCWRSRDRITEAGAEVRDRLIGLRDYLELAEGDRIRMLQSPRGAERTESDVDPRSIVRLYEQLLPYAVIWGVEQEWARVLETRAEEAGAGMDWYRGPHGFSGIALLAALNSTRTAAVPPTQWSSSNTSSFSGGSLGGGFSGGGMGGGGGGGR